MQYFIPLTKKRYDATALKVEVTKLIQAQVDAFTSCSDHDHKEPVFTHNNFNIKKVVAATRVRKTSAKAAKAKIGRAKESESRADYLTRVDAARNVEAPYEKMVMLTQEEKNALFG